MKIFLSIASLVTAICLSMVLIGSSKDNSDSKQIVLIPSVHEDDSFYPPNSLQDVESNSDLIIQATVLPNSKNRTFQHGELTVYGITYTSLEVKKVISGEANVGDQIQITEQYYYVDDVKSRNIYHSGNYAPSTAGQEYIFFLSKYPKTNPEYYGMYFPIGMECARYPVIKSLRRECGDGQRSEYFNVDTFTNSELNLGNEDSAIYRSFLRAVIGKYY